MGGTPAPNHYYPTHMGDMTEHEGPILSFDEGVIVSPGTPREEDDHLHIFSTASEKLI